MLGVVFIAIVTLIAVALTLRARSGAASLIRQMQSLASELQRKACVLDSARSATVESVASAAKRRAEVSALRRDGAALREAVARLATQVNELMAQKEKATATERKLKAALVDCERARRRTQRALEESHARQLELAARFGGEHETTRIRALNRLRRPARLTEATKEGLDGENTNETKNNKKVEEKKEVITKTVSEKYLLSLRPNLNVSDEENNDYDDDDTLSSSSFDVVDRTSETGMSRAVGSAHPVQRLNQLRIVPRRRRTLPVSLANVPWVAAEVTIQSPLVVAMRKIEGVVPRTATGPKDGQR